MPESPPKEPQTNKEYERRRHIVPRDHIEMLIEDWEGRAWRDAYVSVRTFIEQAQTSPAGCVGHLHCATGKCQQLSEYRGGSSRWQRRPHQLIWFLYLTLTLRLEGVSNFGTVLHQTCLVALHLQTLALPFPNQPYIQRHFLSWDCSMHSML